MRIWAGLLFFFLFNTGYPAVKKDIVPAQTTINSIKNLIAGSSYIVLKNPDEARRLAKQALMLSKKAGLRHSIGESFNLIGVSYWVQSNIAISQFYLTLAIPYLKNDKAALSGCYTHIARNYVDLKDYTKSQYYFNEALKLAGNNRNAKAQIYMELISLYIATGNYNKGLSYIDTSFKYNSTAHDTNIEALLYNKLAQIYSAQDILDKAQAALDSSNQVASHLRNKRLKAALQIYTGRLFLLKNKPKDAIAHANMGYLIADSIDASEVKLRALKLLADVYQKQGDLQQNYAVHARINKFYENLNIANNDKTLNLIQEYFKLNTRLNQIEQNNASNTANEELIKVQHKKIGLLVVLLITAIIFSVVVFIYYKQKNELNNKLQAQHEVLLEQKKLIEEQRTDLEEVNKIKDKLLVVIGHDLRTPIASLSNIADLFTADYITAEEAKNLMIDLAPVIKSAELTLSNLMAFASSQIRGKSAMASKFSICPVIEEMKDTFEHQLLQKEIAFINQCFSDSDIWADINHVKVVLRNLISNALKFTNHGGEVKVTSMNKDSHMLICVEDNGIGMTPFEANKLFKANLHFSQPGTSGENGTGLGLLLCKEFIELNGGTIWLETAKNEGCKFYVTLPLYNEDGNYIAGNVIYNTSKNSASAPK